MRCFSMIIFCALCFSQGVYGCTDFLLVNSHDNIVNGRTMDFGFFLESEMVLFPKGKRFTSLLRNNQPGLTYRSKYNYAGITVFESNIVSDGLNEKGLTLGVLWYEGAEYQKLEPRDYAHTLAFQDFPSWILSSFASIDELKQGLKEVRLWAHVIPELGGIPAIHLTVHDKFGKSIVIEFIDHEMTVKDNPIGVLTNNPYLEWHEINLRNYVNLSAINSAPVNLDGSVIAAQGQGSGLQGMPGDWTSVSRYVRTAIIKNSVLPTNSAKENVNLAFHMLNHVDVPYGVIRTRDGKHFDYTQWSVVKDLKNLKYYFRTYEDLNIREVNLRREFATLGSKEKVFPMRGTKINESPSSKSRISAWLHSSYDKVKSVISSL